VGILDTNTIRVLSRYHALQTPWWKTTERIKLQHLADKWVENLNSSTVNQALMELGSLVCTNKKPQCFTCPLTKDCQAYKTKTIHLTPKKKPKRNKEIWLWTPVILTKNKKIAFIKNNHLLPFLRTHLILPGAFFQKKQRPKTYHFVHYITYYTIYVKVNFTKKTTRKNSKLIWLKISEIKKKSPSSLIQKILNPM